MHVAACMVMAWHHSAVHHVDLSLPLQLRSDEGSLLFLLISLRLFPMTPNSLLNMASPVVGVPLHLFFISVLIGKAQPVGGAWFVRWEGTDR